METIRGADARPSVRRPTVATIGMFDGVHRGHVALFQRVIDEARAAEAAAAIVTFDPHPLEVIAPDRAPCVLTTIDQRLELFEQHGFDVTLVLQFDAALASSTPREFVQSTLADELHVRKVLIGRDFRFGNKRAGDVTTLAELGRELGFEAEAITLVGDGAGKISSTDIRRLVAEGDLTRATDLLGRPYRLAGEVARGDGRGRKLGFPTANLSPHARACLPGLGIYAGWWVWGGRRLPGVINVGVRPTFKEFDRPLCEIHVFDFEGDLYGEHGEVEFAAYLRPEVKFDSVDALIEQMHIDAADARRLLARGR